MCIGSSGLAAIVVAQALLKVRRRSLDTRQRLTAPNKALAEGSCPKLKGSPSLLHRWMRKTWQPNYPIAPRWSGSRLPDRSWNSPPGGLGPVRPSATVSG